MKKDILFLCQFTYPEYVSSAVLPFDTAKHLAANGFVVGVLSGYPKEYSIEKCVPVRETVEGVDIRRIRYIQIARGKRFGRLINYFSFTASTLLHFSLIRKYKSIIVYSNPPVLPVIAILSNILFGTRVVFVAYDVYPEIAYASNSIKPGDTIDRVMQWINHKLYKRVSRVVALTDEMKLFIAEKRPEIEPDKIITIANWAHENIREASQDSYKRFGYSQDQFIVSYFGNMGVCQDMSTLMGAALQLRNHPTVQFLIVGHGSKKDYVRDTIKDNVLENVQILDFLTGDDFEHAVAISSCCVVSLQKGLIGTSAPSKYLSYLKAGKPVLTIVDEGSYLHEEVERERIGYMVSQGECEKLANVIMRIATASLERHAMGQRAQDLYQREYRMEIGLSKYERMLDEVTKMNAE